MINDEKQEVEILPDGEMEEIQNREMAIFIDDKITQIINDSMGKIVEDRQASEVMFNELRELFLGGETHPDFVREINKAQENVQKSTENLIKVLDKLSKIKVGADKVQIANLSSKDPDEAGVTKDFLIAMIEAQFKNE